MKKDFGRKAVRQVTRQRYRVNSSQVSISYNKITQLTESSLTAPADKKSETNCQSANSGEKFHEDSVKQKVARFSQKFGGHTASTLCTLYSD